MNFKKNLTTFLPLIIFVILVCLFWKGLKQNPNEIPSPLINKPIPINTVEQLENSSEKISRNDFIGHVTVLNVFASWCISCRVEHSTWMDIENKNSVLIYGLNYKDDRGNAKKWLDQFGNPYAKIIYDPLGSLAIDLGVYGTPETFIIDQQGIIRNKYVGPISIEDWQHKLLPEIQKLSSIK